MINILIVDDSTKKLRTIRELLDSIITQEDETDIDVALDISTTKRIVSRKNIDLMILDIQLPQRVTSPPEKEGGDPFIKRVKRISQISIS